MLCWCLLVLLLAAAPGASAAGGIEGGMSLDTIKSLFRNPPPDRRILQIIHNWPADAAGQDSLIRTLKARGFGGVVCNVHFNDYLKSEAMWESFRQAVRRAKEAGLTLWLYDEQGYPSAAAGGLTLEGHPEWEALGLYVVESEDEEISLPPGTVRAAWACPMDKGKVALGKAVDIRKAVQGQTLRWPSPSGPWRRFVYMEAPLYKGTHAEGNLFVKRPYPNLMQKEPTARFIALTHQAYADRFPGLKEDFDAVFTDEPSLMNVFLTPQPYPALPWSPDFAGEFQKRRGYDILPKLPALTAEAGPETGRVRCDFWRTVGELVAENYFGQIQEWSRAHGIASTGHHLWEETLDYHVGFYGDFFASARRYDIPGIDCLTSDPPTVPWQIAKMLGSVADLTGSSKTMSETSDHSQRYRPPGDSRPVQPVSPAQIKGTCNRLYVAGINTTTSYYSWDDLTDAAIADINAFVGRTGLMLSGTKHRCDIAVYYPIESCWAYFTPASHLATRSQEVQRIGRVFQDVSERLFRAGRDFDYVDGKALAESRVDGNAFTVRERYRLLILPQTDTLPLDAWEKAAAFARSGGAVVAVGRLPANSLSQFPDRAIRAAAREIFGNIREGASAPTMRRNENGGVGVYLPAGQEAILPAVLDALLEPDISIPAGSPIRASHRRLAGGEAYYLINDSPDPLDQKVSLCGQGQAQLWNPEDGSQADLPAEAEGDRSAVRMKLPPYGAAFILFKECRIPLRYSPEKLPMLSLSRLPLAKMVGKPSRKALGPEHVRITQREDASLKRGKDAPLRVEAVLQQGGVDSWCFVNIAFPEPSDLSKAKGFRIATWVPEGQEDCRADLLVILRDAEGGEFLASAARPLVRPGWQTSIVWLESFARAGWSQGGGSQPVMSRIEHINIGWGGYIGQKNERITFALA
ncbi:MAG: hypothetical protein IT210_12380, partial [Armatimonadetes bacterium]|nr:hypothetical protein [Armatimonadota bacterium]